MNELASLGPYAFVQPSSRRLSLAHDRRPGAPASLAVLERVFDLPRGEEPPLKALLDELEKIAQQPHALHLPLLRAALIPSGASVEFCLAHRYLPCSSLASLLDAVRARGEAVPLDVASSITLGVLRAMNVLHASPHRELRSTWGRPFGLAHRQLSPRWVLLGEGGEVTLGGLHEGLASWPWARLKAGQIEALRFAAPEQVRGGAWSVRVDLFRAAAIFWETLTGRPRVEARDLLGLVERVMMQPPQPPSRLRSDVPPEVDAWLLRALARRPEERFESASEMASALASALPPASPLAVVRWASLLGAEPFPGPEVFSLAPSRELPPESDDEPGDGSFYR